MIENMTNEIEQIVERVCAADTNIFGYDIWTHHILQVVENGKQLALRFDADPEIVEFAALLHDYASIKDEALYADHHIHGPIEAEKLLKCFGYPTEKIEAVKAAIATHRGSVTIEHRSAEGACLANADAMSHIEGVPSLLYLAMSIMEWALMKVEYGLKQNYSGVGRSCERMFKISLKTDTKRR